MKPFSLLILFFSSLCLSADDLSLHYDKPATDDIGLTGKRGKTKYMQQALPLGNGRLGTMFNGGVELERLLFNEITLWGGAKRGADPITQAGAREDAYKKLETVREAYRTGKYGTGKGSMETLATEHLATQEPLGHYARFTDISIETGHQLSEVKNYKRALDIEKGLGTVEYDLGGSSFKREYFCSHPHDATMMRLTSSGDPQNLTIKLNMPHKLSALKFKKNTLYVKGAVSMVQDDVQFMQAIYIDAQGGKVSADNTGVIKVTGSKDVVIYTTAYTDYMPVFPTFKGRDYEKDLKAQISALKSAGYEKIKQAHVADISELMGRCELQLEYEPSGLTTDVMIKKKIGAELEVLHFQYARYMQLGCFRSAPVPSNLQGIWNADKKPMWNCDYHTDINLAMNYWMPDPSNLSECFRPYTEYMKVIAEAGKVNAKETFGVDKGWSMGLNGNVYGFTAQNEHGRRHQQAGHWLCQNLYEHYSFTQDQDYLAEIYPIMKGATDFFTEYLAPLDDGTLAISPTWSPECHYNADKPEDLRKMKLNKQCFGANWDQQLLLNLFTDFIEASQLLDRDPELQAKVKKLIPQLSPQKIGRLGQLQEWPEDWDHPSNKHRHISHLIALHPGRDISPLTTPELYHASLTTMKHRGDEATGWSVGWKICFWSRLHNGDRSHDIYKLFLAKRVNPNLFDFHPPFQIDGNFGAAAGVCEMLLQSHLRSVNPEADSVQEAAYVAYQPKSENKKVFVPVVPPDALKDAPFILHLLPALPSEWKNGSISQLKARGGFLVGIKWADGKLQSAKFTATKDGTFRVVYDGKLSSNISLKAGETYDYQ